MQYASYLLSTLGSWVYRRGPFGQNPNYGWWFNDGNLARKYSDPKTFNDIVQSLTYQDGGVCSTIQTTYGNRISTHPSPSAGSPESSKDWTGQKIRFIKGCSSNRINSLSYTSSIQGDGPYNCGSSNEGYGYDGYPFQFTRERCTYLYWAGKTVKLTSGDVALTDIYFYWKC